MRNTILIIDDEKKIRDVFRAALQAEGYKVLEAEDGGQATVLLMENKKIDLFLLDLMLPVVRGTAFFNAVKVYNPQAKVLVSSVYALDKQKDMVEGADDYYDKSDGTEVLIQKVKKVLNQEPASEGGR